MGGTDINCHTDFLLPQYVIDESPSRKFGVSGATEMQLRVFGCEVIQDVGYLLELPQKALATAQMIFHQFYCVSSFTVHDCRVTALACLFLAAKGAEHPKHLRSILAVYSRVMQKRQGQSVRLLDTSHRRYAEWKNDVVKKERFVLNHLSFRLHHELPHTFLLNFAKHVLNADDSFVQACWSYLNDSMRTTLCVRYRPEIIASGCIFLTSRVLKYPLPENPPWWEVFGANEEQVVDVAERVMQLYQLPSAEYINVLPNDDESSSRWDALSASTA